MDETLQLIAAFEHFAKDYAGIVGVVSAAAAVVALLVSPVRSWVAKYRRPRSLDPVLSAPPRGDLGLARYSTQAVELLGREAALSRLKEFLRSDHNFMWMQIAGAGGQGKSRLGYELTLWAQDEGWRAGLVETVDLAAFRGHWASWQPRRPHLLVLDYVIGREVHIKVALQTLASRSDSLRNPVRVLLLERQRWDRGGLGTLGGTADIEGQHGTEGRAEWFLRLAERFDGNDPCLENTRFEDGVLELDRLAESDLNRIARAVAEREGSGIDLSDSAIAEQLRRIDTAGRPLYAYFLGQVFGAGGTVGLGWSRHDLLDATLDRDQGSRWRAALGDDAPVLGDGSLPERLAVIATIAGGLDCTTAQRDGVLPHVDAQTRQHAQILTDAGTGGNGSGPSRQIPSLQPDLLGEWLVLRAVKQGLPIQEVLGPAWRVNHDQTSAFLNRLAQDFPSDPVTQELLDFKPLTPDARKALAGVSASVVRSLFRAGSPIPGSIVEALTDAAQAGDARAMSNLGLLFWRGRGIPQDRAQAWAWWQKGAEAGDGRAMANLGLLYLRGDGVGRDTGRALEWIRKGAEAGDGAAMDYLGSFYLRGDGVERDMKQALAWFRKGAEAGAGSAMASLGARYELGEGVERDMEHALAWYRRGIEAGDGGAMTNLGMCYEMGKGVKPDMQQALAWYRKAADLGSSAAMTALAGCHEDGKGVEVDMPKAIGWYRLGAENGNGEAMASLGACYEYGKGVEQDMEQAVAWYQKGADAGNRYAMGNLGMCYDQGKGVERNVELAIALFRQSAEAGNARSMANLGVSYERGTGVMRDLEEALGWYRRGADAGDGLAMSNLGGCYERGVGVERDMAQAFFWYQKGAEAGDGFAMGNLGTCYAEGKGVPRNIEQALSWFRKAAMTGSATAMMNLGICYHKGLGVECDIDQALAWYRKGANQGHGGAMSSLGLCYEHGQGVNRDLNEALAWFRKGAEAGDELAQRRASMVSAALVLLGGGGDTHSASASWATRWSAKLGSMPWKDSPPLEGEWQDLYRADSLQVLTQIKEALEHALPGDDTDSFEVQRLRTTALPFYRGCSLADLQVQRPGQERVVLVSALVSDFGAALLDGTSALLHALNPDLLELRDTPTAIAYLRFFCAFVRGAEGPLQLVDDVHDMPLDISDNTAAPEELVARLFPLRSIHERVEGQDWLSFEACVLHGSSVLRATFKVSTSGLTEMLDHDPIAEDLPVLRRVYQGAFRSQLGDGL